jgi:HAD superfamily hydrolase (TIGR01509 family)
VTRPLQRGGGPIRSVLFDYGLTLVTFVRPEEALGRAYRDVRARLAAAGVGPVPAAEVLVAEVHDRIERDVAGHEESGALREIDITAAEREAYARLGLHLGDALLDEVSARVQRAWWDGVRLDGDALSVLGTLRARGLRIGLCSNAPYRPHTLRQQLDHIGIGHLLDAVTFSGEIGWRKPAPEIFVEALRRLNVAAHECVMVGDRRREDVLGARRAGMRTVRVREHRDDAGPGDADAVIDGLSELPYVIDARSRGRQAW